MKNNKIIEDSFGSRLKFCIDNYFGGVKEFSKINKITNQAIYAYCRDEREPNLKFIQYLGQIGINLNWLLNGEENILNTFRQKNIPDSIQNINSDLNLSNDDFTDFLKHEHIYKQEHLTGNEITVDDKPEILKKRKLLMIKILAEELLE